MRIGPKAVAWVVGVVLLGAAMGGVSARKQKIRERGDQENAAVLYYKIAEEILQTQVKFKANSAFEPSPADTDKRNERALVALREAVKKDRFNPTDVRVGGKLIGMGRVLEDMDAGASLLCMVARNEARAGDWQQAMADVEGLGKMARQVGSYPKTSKVAADLESLATKAWWSVVSYHDDNPKAMAAAESWLKRFDASKEPAPSMKEPIPFNDGYLEDGQPIPSKGLRPRKVVDFETAYARRHASLQTAKLALAILKTRSYRHPESITADIPQSLLANPFTDQRMTIGGDQGGFMVQCENPTTGTRRDGYLYRIAFQYLESKDMRRLANPW